MKIAELIAAIQNPNTRVEDISKLLNPNLAKQEEKESKFNINERVDGLTVLHYALLRKDFAFLLPLLIGYGADINVLTETKPKLNLLEFVAQQGGPEVISYMLDAFPTACQKRPDMSIRNLIKQNSKLGARQKEFSDRVKDLREMNSAPDEFFKINPVKFVEVINNAYRHAGLFVSVKTLVNLLASELKQYPEGLTNVPFGLPSFFSPKAPLGIYFDPRNYEFDIIKILIDGGVHPDRFKLQIVFDTHPKRFFEFMEYSIDSKPIKFPEQLLVILERINRLNPKMNIKDRDKINFLIGKIHYLAYELTHENEKLIFACLRWNDIHDLKNLRAKEGALVRETFRSVNPECIPYLSCYQRSLVTENYQTIDKKAESKDVIAENEALKKTGWDMFNLAMKHLLMFIVGYRVFDDTESRARNFFMALVEDKLQAELIPDKRSELISSIKRNLEEAIKTIKTSELTPMSFVGGLPAREYLYVLEEIDNCVGLIEKSLRDVPKAGKKR